MLSSEYLKFIQKLKSNPCDNPKRIGYATLRKQQEDRIINDDVNIPGIIQKTVQINGIQAEWLIPESAPRGKAVIYIHGGGWSLGSIRQTRLFLAPMVKRFGISTIHFNYRLMPENPFPAGLDDCYHLYIGLLQSGFRPQNIIISGESAGANLALALMLRLKQDGIALPAAAALMSPITFMDSMQGSHTDLADLDLILAEDSFVLNEVALLYAKDWDKTHPFLSPLYGDLRNLPPMMVLVGTDELLFDDSIRFYQKSRHSGNQIELVVGDHMVHSWPIFMQEFPEAEHAVQKISEFIQRYALYNDRENELRYNNFLVDAALKEIDINYAKANLTKLAVTYNQTLYGYSKLIKLKTGHTFKQLLKDKRFKMIEQELIKTDHSIKSIAVSVGYENLTQFYAMFKRKYGMTPQKYRSHYH